MKFLKDIQKDAKFFIYLNILIMLFRIVFVWLYKEQLSNAVTADIVEAFILGARISLKTSALLTGIGFLFITIPHVFLDKWPAMKLRLLWGNICILFLTLLFIIRIPYYRIFNRTFDIMIFNGMRDDIFAIVDTGIKQYQAIPRIFMVFVISLLCMIVWKRFLKTREWISSRRARLVTGVTLLFVPVFAIFCRFGGAFSYDTGVHWESACRTPNNLLNEAVLDDGQALYRAYSTYKRAYGESTRIISVQELREAIKILGGNADADTLEEAFIHKAKGHCLPEKPKNVVLILGENYALWPLLPQYRALGLAETGILMEKSGAFCYNFLPNGSGTITSLNGFLTGLPSVGIGQNYVMGENGDVSGFAIGTLMKKMGYKTVFWYGGLRNWQNLGNFTLKEGFDEFHCADELPALGESSSWGAPDGILFNAVKKQIDSEPKPTFYFILTTSNHPPFAYDVDAKGFDRKHVSEKLPDMIPKDKETMDQLGHIWYADYVIGEFLTGVQSSSPATLFILTGDHAERFNFARNVSTRELSAVPCFFYGAGVTRDMISPNSAGSHLQIMPTLAEILLPAGESYVSLLPPVFASDKAFNHRLYIEDGNFYEQKDMVNKEFKKYIEAARVVAIWRTMKGRSISKE